MCEKIEASKIFLIIAKKSIKSVMGFFARICGDNWNILETNGRPNVTIDVQWRSFAKKKKKTETKQLKQNVPESIKLPCKP